MSVGELVRFSWIALYSRMTLCVYAYCGQNTSACLRSASQSTSVAVDMGAFLANSASHPRCSAKTPSVRTVSARQCQAPRNGAPAVAPAYLVCCNK